MNHVYPHAGLILFSGATYIALLGAVPEQNLVPATFGVGAFLAMTGCMIYAARSSLVDAFMGGPGRSYRAHRILAHWSWILTIGHWILAQPRGTGWLPGWENFGARAGTFAGLYLLILVFYGLIPAIPYNIWRWTHFAMSPIYVITCAHVFLTAIPLERYGPHWWALVGLALVGLAAMVRVLCHHLHRPRRLRVTSLKRLKDAIDIRLEPGDGFGLPAWKSGQHASISCNRRGLREPHPFTIASSPQKRQMRFVIFNRGDYTERLQTDLKIGDEILINRIAGDFSPRTHANRPYRQIWVAGGAGLTPFLAAMGDLTPDDGPRIDLFYSYRSQDLAVDIPYLRAMADRLPQLVLHLLGDAEGARFNIQSFDAHLPPGWQSSELFACGPGPLLHLASCAYGAAGGQLPVHTEVFEFRNPITTWRQLLGFGPKAVIHQTPPKMDGKRLGPQVVGAPSGSTPAWPHRYQPSEAT